MILKGFNNAYRNKTEPGIWPRGIIDGIYLMIKDQNNMANVRQDNEDARRNVVNLNKALVQILKPCLIFLSSLHF